MDSAKNLIASSKRVLIVSHIQPDADAYGSSLAMAIVFEHLGKEVRVLNESGLFDQFAFLPGSEKVQNAVPTDFQYDLLCICDCGDSKRVGDASMHIFDAANQVLNIDHHTSNSNFGDVNLVRSELSSTCELVYELACSIGVEISKDLATNLLTGIVGDTGSFRYRNTSATTLRLAATLIDAGADLALISGRLYGEKSVAAVCLEADVMSNLEFFNDGKVIKIVATKDLFQKHAATKEDTENLVENARDIKGVQVAVFIREDDELWKVSLRSVNDDLNMSEIAAHFGGGGHKQAAGFRFRGERTALESKLLELIQSQVCP